MKTERTYYILQLPYFKNSWLDYKYHDDGLDIRHEGNTVEELFQDIIGNNYNIPFDTVDELKEYIKGKGWRLVKICETKELEDLEQYLN